MRVIAYGLFGFISLAGAHVSSASTSDLNTKLTEVVAEGSKTHATKGVVIAIVTPSGLTAIAADGIRREGSPDRILTTDRMHLGSCTKAFTALLVATLVADGTLRWNSTIREIFDQHVATSPNGANPNGIMPGATPRTDPSPIDVGWDAVTLEDFLRHRGGATTEAPKEAWAAACACRESPGVCRAEFVQSLLAKPPLHTRGKHAYSNQGYAIVGRLCEVATGMPYESLLATRVLAPLGITQFGFGVPTQSLAESPSGHSATGAVNDVDNPPAIASAGTLHMPLTEWAKFIAFELGGPVPAALQRASIELSRAHSAPNMPEREAMGWFVVDRPWGGRVLTHSGSNTVWYCTAWLAPEKDFAVLAATNQGGDAAARGCDYLCSRMIQICATDLHQEKAPVTEPPAE